MIAETYEVYAEHEGERLDKYLSIIYPDMSRSFFQTLIKEQNIKVNDKCQKANYRMKVEDIVCVCIPDAVETTIVPEDIP